jgi:hypothetical protein
MLDIGLPYPYNFQVYKVLQTLVSGSGHRLSYEGKGG